MSALQAFGGEVEAVFLDVGGVFHLPDPGIIGAALRRAGVDGSLDPELLDRAHYAGIAALVDWPATERGIWTAYEEAYAREVGTPPECVADVVAELDVAFRLDGIWGRLVPGSLDGLRALHATGVALAIVSNSDGTLEGRLAREGICQVGPGAGVPMSIVIDSGAVGVAKPDPAIFTIALEAMRRGAGAGRCTSATQSAPTSTAPWPPACARCTSTPTASAPTTRTPTSPTWPRSAWR